MVSKFENVLGSMRSSAEHFRKGEDQEGLGLLLEGVGGLENTADTLNASALRGLLPHLKKLCLCMQNGDAACLTDVLEFHLCPELAKQAGKDGAQ